MAIRVSTLDSLSVSLPSLIAANTPRPTDSGIATSAAYPAKNRVLRNLGSKSSMMTRLLVRATPKSPCKAPLSQFQ